MTLIAEPVQAKLNANCRPSIESVFSIFFISVFSTPSDRGFIENSDRKRFALYRLFFSSKILSSLYVSRCWIDLKISVKNDVTLMHLSG